MHISLSKAKVSFGLAALLMVLFSFTEVPIMQIEKAVITPFHFAILLLSIPVLLTMPGVIAADRNLLLLTGYIILINLIHFGSVRVTSFIYTLLFIYEYIFLISLLRFIRLADLKKVFLWILGLYFVNILVTFLIVQLHLYSDTIGIFFKAYAGIRPMGFSSEPSYAAFIVTVAFICYNELRYASERKNSIIALIVYVLTVVLSTSAYGLVYVGLYLVFIGFRRAMATPFYYRIMFFSGFAVISIALLTYLSTIPSGPVQRVFDVAAAFVSDKPISDKLEAVNQVDASAWARLGPTWLLFQDGIDKDLLFGHGSGSASFFFQEQMVGILIDSDRGFLDLGIIPAFIYDFGIIGFALLMALIFRLLKRKKIFIFLFILFFFNAGINTQVFWYALVAMAITTQTINRNNSERLKELRENRPGYENID